MTDERARRVRPMLEALRQIPIQDRDRVRLPILGRMLGAVLRAGGAGAALGRDLEAAYIAGATQEELAKRLEAARGVAATELEELQAAIDSWPAREPTRRVVRVSLLPRETPPKGRRG